MFYPELNYTAIITATIVFFAIGGLWYSPFVLGRPWQKLKSFEGEELPATGTAMLFTFLIYLFACWLMYILIGLTQSTTFESGFLSGLMAGLLLVVLSLNNLLYTPQKDQLRQTKLFFIDQGLNLIGLAIVGGILAIWR